MSASTGTTLRPMPSACVLNGRVRWAALEPAPRSRIKDGPPAEGRESWWHRRRIRFKLARARSQAHLSSVHDMILPIG